MGKHTRTERSQGRVRRPAEAEELTAWAARLVGEHDVATGQTSGLLARCAEDPSRLLALRDLKDHVSEAYLKGFALAAASAQEGGAYSYGDFQRLMGISRQSAHENAMKGQRLIDAAKEKLGVVVLRRRRQERLAAAGLADVVELEQRRQATG